MRRSPEGGKGGYPKLKNLAGMQPAAFFYPGFKNGSMTFRPGNSTLEK